MLSVQQIEDMLRVGREGRGVEFKTAGSRRDSHFFAKVTKAALSMGNLRDGGHVVIGVDDADPAKMLPGLSKAEEESWTAYDDVARKLAEYATPALTFDVAAFDLSSGVRVVVIEVEEFSDTPHLCAKDHSDVLRRGALYVRPRKVPETSEIAGLVEMREVLAVATEKALRDYVRTARRAGVELGAPTPTDDDLYRAERDEGWS